MDTLSDTSLGVTAEEFYDGRRAGRTAAVTRGRRLADISIPSVFPPEDWDSGQTIAIPNQSINSHGINTLASKLMLAAFPPGLPMAKLGVIEHKLEDDIASDPELYSEITYALSRREQTHRERMESTLCRSAYVSLARLLLVTGNGLFVWKKIDTPVIHSMHHYVVKREAGGTAIVVVLEESISRMTADEDVVAAADRNKQGAPEAEGGDPWDEEIKVYSCQKVLYDEDGTKEWVYWQEVEGGEVIADSVAYRPYDTPIMYAAWMIPDYEGDWGLPYAQDYEGDMQAVETFCAALQDGAAADSRYITTVDPAGTTDIRDVRDADNLDVIPGREADVGVLRSGKGGDLQTADNQLGAAARRLGQAFLMFSSIQRQGERVTAEEWRIMAQELDEAMGGLYSQIAQTTQRHVVLRFISLHEEEEKDLKPLPKDLVRTSIVTGLDSLGQSSEGTRLREFAVEGKETLGEQVMAQHINPSDYLRRLAATKSIKSEGLVKDEKTMQADQQKQQQAQQQGTMLDKATGPLAKGGAEMVGKMIEQQSQGAQNG